MAFASSSLAASSKSFQKGYAGSSRRSRDVGHQPAVPIGNRPSPILLDFCEFKSIFPPQTIRYNMSQTHQPGNASVPDRATGSSTWATSAGVSGAQTGVRRVVMAPYAAPSILYDEYGTFSQYGSGVPTSYFSEGTCFAAPTTPDGPATCHSPPTCSTWPPRSHSVLTSASHSALGYGEHMTCPEGKIQCLGAVDSSPQASYFSARAPYSPYSAGGSTLFSAHLSGSDDGSVNRWGGQKGAAVPLQPSPSATEPSSPVIATKAVGLVRSRPSTRKHTTREEANFQCDVEGCGKFFSRSYNFKSHMEIHDEKRAYPFPCAVNACTKKFVRKTDLQRHHQSVHVKKRNHQCDYCGRLFARKDTSRRHMEDGCSKRFDIETLDLRTDGYRSADLVELPPRAGVNRIAMSHGAMAHACYMSEPRDARGNRVELAGCNDEALGSTSEG